MHEKYLLRAELPNAIWRKSPRSNSGDCVEWALLSGNHVALRDSKNPDPNAVLIFTAAEWSAFVGVDGEPGGVRGGQFDL